MDTGFGEGSLILGVVIKELSVDFKERIVKRMVREGSS